MDDAEFTRRRSSREYIQWVDGWSTHRIAGIEQYFGLMRRSESWDKKMLEEAIAVQKYVRLSYADQDQVYVELNSERGGGQDGFDAKITAPDGRVLEYVQVTVVPTKDEHIDRFIVSGGYTYQADEERPMSVTKSAYDREEYLRQLATYADLTGYADLVIARIRKKTAKAYQRPSSLIVVLDPDMIVENKERFDSVIAQISEQFSDFGPFSTVTVTAFGTGLVHRWESPRSGEARQEGRSVS